MQQPNAMFYTVVPPDFSQGGTDFPGILSPPTTSWGPTPCNSMPPNGTATPVSTAMYGTTSTFSWAHTVPALMPWASKAGGQITDPVMRFTAPFPPDPCTSQTATSWELLHNLGTNNMNANLHLKRRSEGDDMSVGPQKQYITEEKMAARMRELHISNQYSLPEQTSPFGPYGNSPDTNKTHKRITSVEELNATLAEELSEESSDPFSTFSSKCSIVLAPEIKKLVEPEKLFAKTFVEEIERPNMAVVLWKPPEGAIKKIMNSQPDPKHEEENRESSRSQSVMKSPCLYTQLIEQELNNNFLPIPSRNPIQFICPTPPSSPAPCAILNTSVPDEDSASPQFDSDDIMDL